MSSTAHLPASSPSSTEPQPTRILFVCLGNICRSPMAHGIFQHITQNLSSSSASTSSHTFVLDSAGTGAYHAGSDPDPRTTSTLKAHGITDFKHHARKIRTRDFYDFDYVLAMDEENLEDLRVVRRRAEREKDGDEVRKGASSASPAGRRRPGQTAAGGSGGGSEEGGEGGEGDGLARLAMFGDFGGRKGEVIEVPWYGGGEGFEVAYEQCVRFSKGLLREVLGEDVQVGLK